MDYLPTCCEACGQVALRPETESNGGDFVCASCSGAAHIVPGCNYAEDDVALFSELSQIVSEAAIPPLQAEQMSLDAHNACALGLEREALARLGARLPLLTQTPLIFHAQRQRKNLLMLATILEAAAVTRGSGTMPAAIAPTPRDKTPPLE
jgi:hypothetical protein